MKPSISLPLAAALLVTVCSVGEASAQAYSYASGSVSLMQQGDLYSLPTVSGVVFGEGAPRAVFGVGATVRITVNHFLLQPSLAFAFGGVPGILGTSFGIAPGFGFGGAVAVSQRVALSPMLRVNALLYPSDAGTTAIVPIMGELPITIFVGQNGIIEPYVDVGAVFVSTPARSAYVAGLIGVGYRIGVRF